MPGRYRRRMREAGTAFSCRRAALATLVSVISVASLLSLGGVASAANRSPVVPRNGKVAGEGYAYYLARGWQIDFSSSLAPPPCTIVTVNGKPVTIVPEGVGGAVTCDLAAGQPIYMAGPSLECSTLEGDHPGFGTTPSQLELCARAGFQVAAIVASASLDGQPVTNYNELVTRTKVFPISPADGRSAAYGYGLLLTGLPEGIHVLHTTGTAFGVTSETTLTLHVH